MLDHLIKREDVELQVVVAASVLLDKTGAVGEQIQRDYPVVATIYSHLEGGQPHLMAKTTGLLLIELSTAFDRLRPDVVVTIADRFETIATAIAASYQNIPVAHIQGGELTGSIDERVRHAVTKLSDIHFAATKRAGERIVQMGENPERVYVTGCPSIDLCRLVLPDGAEPNLVKVPELRGVGYPVDLQEEYVVVCQHPDTATHSKAFREMTDTLDAVSRTHLTAVWIWPNLDAGTDGASEAIRAWRENHRDDRILYVKNLGAEDYIRLLARARCLVGNSSAGIRECSYLATSAVNIGPRQQGREQAENVVNVWYESDDIHDAICIYAGGQAKRSTLYGDGHAGEYIAELLATVELDHRKHWSEPCAVEC